MFDLRFPEKNARLVGVEYIIPKHVYLTLPDDEKRLWHSHDFEVKSGILVLPKPERAGPEKWEVAETEAMKEVVGLYGKTWHFWQVDRGDQLLLGHPVLMASLTKSTQIDLGLALLDRNARFGVDHKKKAKNRSSIEHHDVHHHVDSWWKEANQ